MAAFADSEEEWSESELFDEAAEGEGRPPRIGSGHQGRGEPSSVSPAPEESSAAPGPALKLRPYPLLHSGPSSGEEGPLEESSRSPFAAARAMTASPGLQPGQKRVCTFGTPENTPRAEKVVDEFPQPAASCPVAILHKKQHMAEAPAADQVASPEHPFMPPHELLAQTLPEYDADSARLGFRPGSVMEGAGRKLQGRDAVQFRRAIMRQTGFLENEERFGQSVPG